MAYMKKVTDSTTDVGYGSGWFKISEAGLNVASKIIQHENCGILLTNFYLKHKIGLSRIWYGSLFGDPKNILILPDCCSW
jgi:hypothetical protein